MPQPRVPDQQLHVVVVLLRRGGDAEHRVVGAVLGRLEPDDVVVAGAEMEDGGTLRLLLREVLEEVHVAGTLRLVEAPGLVPVVELVLVIVGALRPSRLLVHVASASARRADGRQDGAVRVALERELAVVAAVRSRPLCQADDDARPAGRS